jgi:hypothetical protein
MKDAMDLPVDLDGNEVITYHTIGYASGSFFDVLAIAIERARVMNTKSTVWKCVGYDLGCEVVVMKTNLFRELTNNDE